MRIALSPAARRDRREAVLWYTRVSSVAAHAFIDELDRALRYISRYPHGSPRTQEGWRAKTLRRFPFSVIYDVLPHRIRVHAILDERRDPESRHPFSN